MDQLVLGRLTAELDARHRGTRLDQIYALPKDHVAIVLGRSSAPRLWLSTESDHPHLYERPGPHSTPKRPPAFAMAARKAISGRRVAGLTVLGNDRVVELRCQDDFRIVFELIPRRATALVVGADGRVRAAWHPRRSRPAIGETYRPPRRTARRHTGELDLEDWALLHAAPDAAALSRSLIRLVRGVSPLIAREIAARHEPSAELRQTIEAELERAVDEPTAARIYSPAPLEELTSLPGTAAFLLAPYPLRHVEKPATGKPAIITRYADLADAAAAFYPLRAKLAALGKARQELYNALSVRLARVERTTEAVTSDLETAGDPGTHRRRGDLLLAHPNAPIDAGIARLPDDYGDGQPIEVPVDPSISLVANAEKYYRKARRADRGRRHTERRLRRLRTDAKELARLRSEAEELRDLGSCRRVARAARRRGVVLRAEAWKAPEAPVRDDQPAPSEDTAVAAGSSASAGPDSERLPAGDDRPSGAPQVGRRLVAGVLAFTSSDGLEILVGRNARANDRLTHKVAAPRDFWLHAEGPGSHVVIRNPDQVESPPEDTLREAAALAAHYSFARGATKVNVRFTTVRHLRKPRGGKPGQVLVRQAETLLAEPVAPQVLFQQAGRS